MANSTTTLSPPCLCGCGQLPNPGRQWIRGHASRGEGGYRGEPAADVPNPRVVIEQEMTPDEWDRLAAGATWAEPEGYMDGAGPGGPRVVEDIPAGVWEGTAYEDAPPAHASPEWARSAPGGPIIVTAAVRRSIVAKIKFILMPVELLVQLRDPYCGGTLAAQRNPIADAWADVVCDSPQLVEFFEGPAGKYMKYFKVGAAMLPVGETFVAHHVMHTVGDKAKGEGEGTGQPQAGNIYRPAPPNPARYPA